MELIATDAQIHFLVMLTSLPCSRCPPLEIPASADSPSELG
jgi:hypothetical protein